MVTRSRPRYGRTSHDQGQQMRVEVGAVWVGRYLLTRVAGLIASRVAELPQSSGHTVAGVDNLNDASASDLRQGTALAGFDAAKTTRAILKT